ncbi:MAG TPA: CPBP family intramembrane metalloprotease [Candidatus Atribacteria bacterium]|nr:CPBP family intramembrane metalloprotease [Candidatus Atribacteria bacterium]
MTNGRCNKTGLSIAVITLLLIYQQFASKVGSLVAESFDYKAIDEYGIYANVSLHHIVQMLIALLAILLLTRKYKIDFGFSAGDRKTGIKYLMIFTVAVLMFTLISYGIRYLGNQTIQYDYPLNAKNVLGTLGFQLLLSGTSEEILFRALPIGILSFLFGNNKDRKCTKMNISYEVIIAAILFSIAHIRWTIDPFSISVNHLQLIYCFVLGIVYGKAYQESNSVIYPMIMHSISNVILVGVGYIISIMSG